MDSIKGKYPLARNAGLIAREVSGELLVYDVQRDKAHCLNDSAARIWRYCDGEKSAAEIAKLLAQDLRGSVEEEFVWHALARLQKLHLLEEDVVPTELLAQLSRRTTIRRLALGIVAAPLISTILAPIPEASASHPICIPLGPCIPGGPH